MRIAANLSRLAWTCLLFHCFLWGCSAAPTGGPRLPPKVEHVGALHTMFEEGSAAAHASLAALLGREHLYALGPLEGLRGEILVWDGTPFTSRIEQGAVHVAVDADAKAPFLVWSYVKEWSEVEVPEEAKTLAGFETWLPGAARKAGVDGSRPFAFLLLGAVDSATIHVVDLAPGEPLTHESHRAAKHVVQLEKQPVQLLGFFARAESGAQGVYMFLPSTVHLCLRTQFGTTMGHVEDFSLAPGATLKLAWK